MNLSTNANVKELSGLQIVQDQIGSLRFGIIQIVVHDSRVVQIERTEKLRFDKLDHKSPAGEQDC